MLIFIFIFGFISDFVIFFFFFTLKYLGELVVFYNP